jgi:hypothetical protein
MILSQGPLPNSVANRSYADFLFDGMTLMLLSYFMYILWYLPNICIHPLTILSVLSAFAFWKGGTRIMMKYLKKFNATIRVFALALVQQYLNDYYELSDAKTFIE